MGAASTLFSTNTSQKIQVFSRWQTFNGFRKQVTMKLKKKKKKISRYSKLKLCSTFKGDFDDNEKKG